MDAVFFFRGFLSSPPKTKLVFEIPPCFQYFRALLNEVEPDAKQHPEHICSIISSRASIKINYASLDPMVRIQQLYSKLSQGTLDLNENVSQLYEKYIHPS